MDWTHSKPTYGTTTCKMAGFFGISKNYFISLFY
jgi:hypothetical protein